MRTLRLGKDEIPFKSCVVALGFFDGVHLAHRELLRIAKEKARALNAPAVAFTFPSESSELKPSSLRLYSTDEKLSLISERALDFTLLADFSRVRDMSAEEFVSDILISVLGARRVVVGYNFTYGKDRSGNADTLKSSLAGFGAECDIVEEMKLSGDTLSTTFIKELLESGQLSQATKALGKPYFISGEVVRGNGVGRSLGSPTVNISLDNSRYNLPSGVYATLTELDGVYYPSVTNLGECPTLGRREIHAETDILNFSGDLYGKSIRIYFLKYLRSEIEFPNEKELIKQINIDKEAALRFTSEVSCQELGLN